jgi:hypothetical protein
MLFVDAYHPDTPDDVDGSATFYRDEPSFDDAQRLGISVRARLTADYWAGGLSFAPIYLGFGVSDGVRLALVWPGPDPDDGAVQVNWLGAPEHKSDDDVTNWAELHTYDVLISKLSEPYQFYVLVDGDPVLEVPYSDLVVWPGPFPDLDTAMVAAFGGSSSDSEWDFVQYKACGPPGPWFVLDFFDQAVEQGTLYGTGPVPAAQEQRLNALRQMLLDATYSVAEGDIEAGCEQLQDVYELTDGQSPPSDLVAGFAAPTLAGMILQQTEMMECP